MGKPRWLWIALVAAVVVGGAASALVMRGERVTGRRATRGEVLDTTFGAMAAGDVDAVVALIDPVAMFAPAVECKGSDGEREGTARDAEAREEQARNAAGRDPHALRDQARIDYASLVARAKRLSIDVVSIAEAGPPNRTAKGAPMMQGCVAPRALALHRSRVALRIRSGGQQHDQEVVVATVEVAGRWFLSTPPALHE